jgi:hypothetical protein
MTLRECTNRSPPLGLGRASGLRFSRPKGYRWHAFLGHRTKRRANRLQSPSRRQFRPCLPLLSRRRDRRLQGDAGRTVQAPPLALTTFGTDKRPEATSLGAAREGVIFRTVSSLAFT